MTEPLTTETLKPTKGTDVSDNNIPPYAAGQRPQQPPPPPVPPSHPAPPPQAHLGAAPQPGYTAPQPGYAPPQQPYGAPQQPYGAGYPMQPAYAPVGYAPPRPNSGQAITSLICGLAGLLLFWLVVPVAASIVAVITGHMALKQIKRNPVLGGRGMAITGLITGYIGVGIVVAEILFFVLSLVFLGAFTIPFITSQT